MKASEEEKLANELLTKIMGPDLLQFFKKLRKCSDYFENALGEKMFSKFRIKPLFTDHYFSSTNDVEFTVRGRCLWKFVGQSVKRAGTTGTVDIRNEGLDKEQLSVDGEQ